MIGTFAAAIAGLNFESIDADADGQADDLRILYNGEQIDVINHYNASGSDPAASTPGVGAIETLTFVNGATAFGYAINGNPYSVNADRLSPIPAVGAATNDILASDGNGETLNGGDGNDLLFGNAGNDTLNGGTGNDLLVGGADDDTIEGGAGADVIDVGTGQNIVRFSATADFGDTILNFDLDDGTEATDDRLEFTGALATLLDDVTVNGAIQFNTANGAGNNSNQAVDLSLLEALFLDGSANNGVTNANITSSAAVAAEFNAEFAITAAAGETTLLVINDTDANSSSVWLYTEATGAGEITGGVGGELQFVALVNSNAAIATGNLDFV